MRSLVLSTSLTLFLAAGNAPLSSALNIPLDVQQLLPTGVPGKTRTNDPVSVGVPLPDGSGITSASQLGLSGPSAGQFRILAYWPSGQAKWVLADFDTTVLSDGVTPAMLVDGSGNFGGPNLATDQGSTLSIATGAGTFVVQKANFDVLHQATVAGQTFVRSGGQGVLVRSGGVTYTSVNDASSATSLEENGPVKAVVVSKGALKSSSGTRLMDYTCRLYFYAGAAWVRTVVTLRNAASSQTSPVAVSSAEVDLPLSLGSGRAFSFGRYGTSPITGTFSGSETAYLFQAVTRIAGASDGNGNEQWNNGVQTPPMEAIDTTAWNYVQKGLEIKQGTTVLNALSTVDATPAAGWAELYDANGKGVTFGYRWLNAYWPGGFEFDGDANAQVGLLSKHNSLGSISFAWGAWDTRELLFDFHTSGVDNDLVLWRLQYPLYARASLDQYTSAGAFLGETKLVSMSEQEMWFSAHGGTNPLTWNASMEYWRFYAWSQGGGYNQSDQALLNLVDFVRTGGGGWFLRGQQGNQLKCDNGIRHSDGFDFRNNPISPDNSGCYNKRAFDEDGAHTHIMSLPIYYWMTGDELVKEAMLDYAEWGDATTSSPQTYLSTPYVTDMRIWSRCLRNMAVVEEFTSDNHYANVVNAMLTQWLDQTEAGSDCSILSFGRNLTRGYVWQRGDCGPPRDLSAHIYTTQIEPEAIWQGYRLFVRKGLPRTQEILDALAGLADFVFGEYYFEVNGGTGYRDLGYLYQYHLDQANSTPASASLWPETASRLFANAYEQSGDTKYLDREAKVMMQAIGVVTDRLPSDPNSQALMWDDLHHPTPPWKDLTPTVSHTAGTGAWTLSWTTPINVSAYKVKYATKPIRDWLGFNQATRVYQYDPAGNTAWFAATRTTTDPPLQASGTTTNFVITGLDPTKTYSFAVKYESPSIPPSPPTSLRLR